MDRFRRITLSIGVAATLTSPGLARGQATADQARLSVGLAVGASSGASAWHVSGQPIAANPTLIDTVSLSRRLDGSISAALTLTYFPHPHWGVSGEVALIGGRYNTRCVVATNGSPTNTQVCNSINQSAKKSSIAALDVGGVYRPLSRSSISPYLSARIGLLVGSLNSVETVGTVGGSLYILYHDDHPSGARVGSMLGAGVTAPAGPGYQFRWEVRDVIMGVDEVTGVTDGRPQGAPAHDVRYYHRFTFLFGFEVVLDRSRGHRY
jgi:hypothetical protein